MSQSVGISSKINTLLFTFLLPKKLGSKKELNVDYNGFLLTMGVIAYPRINQKIISSEIEITLVCE